MKDEGGRTKKNEDRGGGLHPSSFLLHPSLFLIGYRCTGKTAVGRRLAERLGRPFVDLDVRIVERCGANIRSLVDSRGWAFFRAAEKEALKEICTGSSLVVATGGGVVLDPENIVEMRKNGTIVWLRASIETIRQRMAGDPATGDQRPSLTLKGMMDEIETVLGERNPLYRKAMDYYVKTDLLGIQGICDAVLGKLSR